MVIRMKKEYPNLHRIKESIKPTRLKIIPLIIILIFLELVLFTSRLSVDCFGPDCDYNAIAKAADKEEINFRVYGNLFITLPVLISMYAFFCLIAFAYKKVKR